jgi:hypothetical protein
MALVPFTSTVTAATLNANFDDARAAITSQAVAGQIDLAIHHKSLLLAGTGTDVKDFVDFIPEDDYEVRVLRVYATDVTAGQVVTASVVVANGDTTFLVDQSITVSVTTGASTVVQASADFRTVTGTRVRLLKGVPYRLKLSRDTGTIDEARAMLLVRTIRRIA